MVCRPIGPLSTFLFVVISIISTVTTASAQPAYPKKPINLIVPIPAGAVVDLFARSVAEEAKQSLQQPVVVMNRVGAAGTVGTAEVIAAKPDGYTIGFVTRIMLTLQPQRTELPYKGPEDLQPVINLASLPYVVAVRTESPWTTLNDLIAFAKANPGKLRFGRAGAGTVEDINLRIVQEKNEISFAVVPVTGDAEASAQILGGHIDTKFLGGSIAPMVKAGKMRALAVVGDQRSPLFPDTPTFRELGYDFGLLPHFCIIAPKGTPKNIVEILHKAFQKALESERVKKTASENMIFLEYLGTNDLKNQLGQENTLFRDIIKKYDLK